MAINPMQNYAQAGFWSGAVIMISFHNMIVSILMYKSRQTNVSNILKIIFNFGQLVRSLGLWSYYMTPDLPTVSLCTGIQYFVMFGNVISRLSLSTFLLWRLRQINFKSDKLDKIMSTILLVARVAITVPDMIMQTPGTVYNPLTGRNICSLRNNSLAYSVGGIGIDLAIDIYVTVRLVYILKTANKNASQARASSNLKSRRTLFTAVMYWNFLRLFVAFLFDFTGIIYQYIPLLSGSGVGYADVVVKCTIYISLSYVVTVDAEIVKVIEGKGTKRETTSGTLKSVSSSRTPRYSGSNPPKYSPTQSTSQIGEDKIAVISMKRLSFFEWANVVVGGRLFKNKGDEQQYDDEYDDKGTEEVIDGPSDSIKDEDIEKGIPQDRRSSNFSGTTATETSTLDGNPDIVIN